MSFLHLSAKIHNFLVELHKSHVEVRKINQLMMEKLDKYAFYMQAKH